MDTVQFTQEDIAQLRSIEPRKSILNFSDSEVKVTAKFNAQFAIELGTRSPYVRRSHDWCKMSSSSVKVTNVENNGKTIADLKEDIKQKISPTGEPYYEIPRGYVKNRDTGIKINVGRTGLLDTQNFIIVNDKRKKEIFPLINAVYSITSLIENGILLNTSTSDDKSNKSPDGVFMHSLYAPFNFEDEPHIAKISVQEILNIQEQSNLRNFYNVLDIKIVPLGRSDFGIENNTQPAKSFKFGTTVSVSQLFDFVKTYDKNFYTNLSSTGRQERLNEIAANDAHR